MRKNRINKKFIGSGMFVFCMMLTVLFTALYVKANEEKTIQYLKRTYTIDNTAPDTPIGYLFAGWYNDADPTTNDAVVSPILNQEYYAKFVPVEVLDIKAQVSDTLYDKNSANDSSAAIRFITTVDSLEYKHIGFNIQKGEKTPEDAATTKYVYKELYAIDAKDNTGSKSKYTPKVFHDESEFFKTWTISNIVDTTYNTSVTVIPYWITLDGTRVEGERAVKTVNMGRSWVYVDSTDSDTEELGTYDDPYKTLPGAMEHETPLDPTVILKSDVTLTEQITVAKNLTLTNEKNVTVTEGADVSGDLFTVAENVTFTVTGAKGTTITMDAVDVEAEEGSLVEVSANGSLSMTNVKMTGVYNSGNGGAIYNSGTVTLLGGCAFENNKANNAGAIFNAGVLTDTSSIYKNNMATAASSGGAVRNNGGKATFSGSTFIGNSTKDDGGALYSDGNAKQLEMMNCTFDGNTALRGGALYINVSGCEFKGTDCIFTNNSATKVPTDSTQWAGGAVVFTGSGTAYLTNSNELEESYDYEKAYFTGNQASNSYGGALVVNSSATLHVSGYEFNSNSAKEGGAILNCGITNDTGCQYEKNSTTGNGAGVRNLLQFTKNGGNFIDNTAGSSGGAIRNISGARFDVTDVTFSGNTGNYGGAIWQSGDMTLTNATFNQNTGNRVGGGIYVDQNNDTTLAACTFAQNAAPNGRDIAIEEISDSTKIGTCTFDNEGNNVYLMSDDTAQAQVILNGKSTGMTVVYSKDDLGALIGEGFDSGSVITINPNDYQLDVQVIGYVEGAEENFEAATACFNVPTDEYNYEWTVDTNGCLQANLPYATIGDMKYDSLNAAITAASANDTITIWRNNTMDSAVSIEKSITITNVRDVKIIEGADVTGSLFDIPENVVLNITGKEDTIITIDGEDTEAEAGCLVEVSQNATLKMSNVKMTGVYNSGNGGAIYNEGTVTLLSGCAFENNKANNAGAIFNAGVLTDTGSVYSQNEAIGDTSGGAVRNNTGGTATFNNCVFTDNKCLLDDGGAIYSAGNMLTLSSVKFINNKSVRGGAVYVNLSSATEEVGFIGTDCIFDGNVATNNGGAIGVRNNGTSKKIAQLLNSKEDLSVEGYYEHSYFNGNSSTSGNGGALYAFDTNLNLIINGYEFKENTTDENHGGALAVSDSTVSMYDVSMLSNESAAEGGAIFVQGSSANVEIKDSNLNENIARNGGAAYLYNGSIVFNATKLSENNANTGAGGAIYSSSNCSVTIKNGCELEGNYTTTDSKCGGAIYTTGGTLICNSSVFKNNHTDGNLNGHGGAIYLQNATIMQVEECQFTGNYTKAKYKDGGSDSHGGAIFIYNSSFSDTSNNGYIKNCSFDSNIAGYGDGTGNGAGAVGNNGSGGAIGVSTVPGFTISGCNFTSNRADNRGGAIFTNNDDTIVYVTSCEFNGNASMYSGGDRGGAMHANPGTIYYDSACTFRTSTDTINGIDASGTVTKLSE